MPTSRKTSRSRPLNVSVSVSSRTENQTSRSRLGLGPQGLVYTDKNLRQEQAGFRPGRSCNDQIFALRQIITRKPSFLTNLTNRATLAKSLHGLRKSSGVVSCIAGCLSTASLWCPITSYIVTVSVKCVALEILAF